MNAIQVRNLTKKYADFTLDNISFSYKQTCKYTLLQTTRDHINMQSHPFVDNADILWQGARKSERHEVFLLLRLNK